MTDAELNAEIAHLDGLCRDLSGSMEDAHAAGNGAESLRFEQEWHVADRQRDAALILLSRRRAAAKLARLASEALDDANGAERAFEALRADAARRAA